MVLLGFAMMLVHLYGEGTRHNCLVPNPRWQAAVHSACPFGGHRQLPVLALLFQAIRAINGGDHETSAEEFTNRVFNKIDVNGDGKIPVFVLRLRQSLCYKETPMFLIEHYGSSFHICLLYEFSTSNAFSVNVAKAFFPTSRT